MQKGNANSQPRLPSLDLLKAFEAAARLLSFTKAGEELFLSQSAVSRQIQDLEEQLGVPLFQRKHRALALTQAGQQFYPPAAQVLATVRTAVDRLRAAGGQRVVAVTTNVTFAALWLVPRLARFTRENPGVDVRIAADTRLHDLERDGFDVALRYCPPAVAGAQAVRLFGETVFPVCSPQLANDPKRPLRQPADLARHVLLHIDDPEGQTPWLSWRAWLEAEGAGDLQPAANLRFTNYSEVMPAALAGQGIALGRSPLVRDALREGALVAPFRREAASSRAYFLIVAPGAAQRPEVARFVDWAKREARR